MDIFNYDPRTGAFTGASVADASPLEPGKFLVPAYAVTVPPPQFPSGSVAAWNDASWVVLMDRRGQVWFNRAGQQVLVDFLGDPAQRGLQADAPPPPPPPPPADEDGIPLLTPRQIRLGLLAAGIGADVIVHALMATEASDAAMIEWQYATAFHRNHPLVLEVAEALELSSEQIDDLWVYAATL